MSDSGYVIKSKIQTGGDQHIEIATKVNKKIKDVIIQIGVLKELAEIIYNYCCSEMTFDVKLIYKNETLSDKIMLLTVNSNILHTVKLNNLGCFLKYNNIIYRTYYYDHSNFKFSEFYVKELLTNEIGCMDLLNYHEEIILPLGRLSNSLNQFVSEYNKFVSLHELIKKRNSIIVKKDYQIIPSVVYEFINEETKNIFLDVPLFTNLLNKFYFNQNIQVS